MSTSDRVVYSTTMLYRNRHPCFEGMLYDPRTKTISRCGHMHRYDDLATTCVRRQAAKLNKAH